MMPSFVLYSFEENFDRYFFPAVSRIRSMTVAVYDVCMISFIRDTNEI